MTRRPDDLPEELLEENRMYLHVNKSYDMWSEPYFSTPTKPDGGLSMPREELIRIKHPWGYGNWVTADNRKNLEAWCAEANAKYGEATHYVESEFDTPEERRFAPDSTRCGTVR